MTANPGTTVNPVTINTNRATALRAFAALDKLFGAAEHSDGDRVPVNAFQLDEEEAVALRSLRLALQHGALASAFGP